MVHQSPLPAGDRAGGAGRAMERFLDMHMYITSALQKTDMKAVGLQLALELLHEKVNITSNGFLL